MKLSRLLGKRCLGMLLALCLSVAPFRAQNIPVPLTQIRLYDLIDELATEGIIQINEAVRPYSRRQVADWLQQAVGQSERLDERQRRDIDFYVNDLALERDTIGRRYVQWTDNNTFNLSLGNPQFAYITPKRNFKLQLRPILGMDIIGSQKGAIFKRWWGFDLQMDIAHHLSIWGSLRDVSYNGSWALRGNYFPTATDKMNGARITAPGLLNNIAGVEYKEATYGGDFSDSKGGISLYTWWGSVSLSRENLRWGDAYHSSNILSGHNPAVPQLSLQLTPVWWLQFDYFHAWLVSNVLNEEDYYVENMLFDVNTQTTVQTRSLRPRHKYMAANMLTFMPCKWVHFSLGNSIVYAENQPEAAYFIPIAFFKSLDHLLTKGTGTQNQNSQAFFTITVRPVEHLKLYTSCYVDEIKFNRFKASNPANNLISYLVGFDWGGWPLKGLSLKGEFMRSYIGCYTNSIDALAYTSNSYLMGHYMGDNAQSIFVELSYRPIRGMWVALDLTHDTKYNNYRYLRRGISTAIEQKPFDKAIFRNVEVAARLAYEVLPDMFLRVQVAYNHAQGFDNTTVRTIGSTTNVAVGEQLGTAQNYLDRFCPVFFQGRNLYAVAGFSFGF